MEAPEPAPSAAAGGKKDHNKYRRPKPWDTADVEHWKVDAWRPEFLPAPLTEESSFATLFPQYREKYLREVWPLVTNELSRHGVACELNLVEGSMTVRTTRKTSDPFLILKARDLIKLLARSVPVQQAVKVLRDDTQCDIIKVGGMVRNKERFVKRRQRLVGPDGTTLRALELLTECYILVQGNTVACMGPWKGLKVARRVVEDCMANVHPIYQIKTLMIRRELAKDPQLKDENWERFLPDFRRKNVPCKKPAAAAGGAAAASGAGKRDKGSYTPFPPANHQPLSKVDLALESGEYFLSEAQKERRRAEVRATEAAKKAEGAQALRAAEFEPPAERAAASAAKQSSKKRGRAEDVAAAATAEDAAAAKQAAKEERRRLKELRLRFGGGEEGGMVGPTQA